MMNTIPLTAPFLASTARFTNQFLTLLVLGVATGCTFQVDSFLDSPDGNPGDFICDTGTGICTLRAAVMEANAAPTADTILIPQGTYNLNLPIASGGGRLEIINSVTLQGSGKDDVIINQTVSDAVIQVMGGDVAINNLTLQGGDSQAGGGIRIEDGVVAITDVVIRENVGFTGGGGLLVNVDGEATVTRVAIRDNSATGAFGGGIWNLGTLWVFESEVTDNQSNRAGGIHNSGILNLRNVTVSGNTANSPEAGVGGISQTEFAVLNNVTVTENTGVGNDPGTFRGGGIQTSMDATTVIKNSIVANNQGGTGPDDCVGPLTPDSKYNLIGNSEGCVISSFVSTYFLDVPANLGPLTFNGGPTRTHLTGSSSLARDSAYPFPPPAIDACQSHDQRGVPRPEGAGNCDMGAVEYTDSVQYVTGFELVDADTNTDLGPLLHGDTLDLGALPPALTIRAAVGTAGSVVFDYDDTEAIQTENNAPFALAGDVSGDYAPFEFTAGEHSIRATPYLSDGGIGAAGGSWHITFKVID